MLAQKNLSSVGEIITSVGASERESNNLSFCGRIRERKRQVEFGSTMTSSPESLPPGWEGTTTTSPETQPPEWETDIASSPESLPPGFENPIPQPTPPPLPPPPLPPPPTLPPPPPQQNPPVSQAPPLAQLLRESQSNPRSPPPPLECQCHHPPSSPKPLQETQASLPHQQENLDAVRHPPPQGNLGSLHPPPLQHLSEMGQMVCGNCNELLSYPRGSKYIQCACCQTVNFVLEAHEVGIVKCGKCAVLLMYPYGAKSLRCSTCHSVTEIGPHNIRPPVSVLQGFPAQPQNAAH